MLRKRLGAIRAPAAWLAIIAGCLAATPPAVAQEAIPIKGSREKGIVIRDPGDLPPAVARTRARLLDMAARADVKAFVAGMKKAGDAPRLSAGADHDAAQLWADAFPENKGLGALYQITGLLGGAGLKRADGSVEWPYYAPADFARLPATEAQEVIVLLGRSQFDEVKAGSYSGWHLSISAKGKWTAFLHG